MANSRTGQKPYSKKKGKLIQSQVPLPLYERIHKCADDEMISVSAYVRRILQNQVPGG